jgi:hypothetical protein
MRIFNALSATLLCAALPLLSGCGDDFGQACEMPDTPEFEALCSVAPDCSADAECLPTCVFANAPECSTRTCARYQGSRDFCTEACTPGSTNECPTDAVCYTTPGADEGFCVPLAVYENP